MVSLHGYFRFVEPEMHWCPPSCPFLHCCPSALLLVIHNRYHYTSKGPSSTKHSSTNLIIGTSLRALPHRVSWAAGKHAEPFGLLPSPLQHLWALQWLLLIFWFMLFYTVLINKILQRIIKLTEKRKKKKKAMRDESSSGFNELSSREISLPQLRAQSCCSDPQMRRESQVFKAKTWNSETGIWLAH